MLLKHGLAVLADRHKSPIVGLLTAMLALDVNLRKAEVVQQSRHIRVGTVLARQRPGVATKSGSLQPMRLPRPRPNTNPSGAR